MKLKAAVLSSAVLTMTLVIAPAAQSFAPFETNNKIYIGNSGAGKTTPLTIDFSHKCVGVPEPCVPPGGTALKITFPSGTKVNPGIKEACPTEIFRETYGDGCQASSRIGRGTGVLDARELNLGLMDATVDVYKIDRKSGDVITAGLIAHQEDSGANVPYEFGVKKEGGRVVLDIEDFAVPPIFNGRVVLVQGRFLINSSGKIKERVKSKKGKKGKKKRRWRKVKKYLITNPKRCSSTATWSYKVDQKWEGGSLTSQQIHVPCSKAAKKKKSKKSKKK